MTASPIPSADMREKVARIIADHMSGGFDTALQDKQEWIDRCGLGYDCEPLDVNGPFKDDFWDAADAILALAPPAVGVAEPVAWRVLLPNGMIGYHTSERNCRADASINHAAVVEPLFAHPQPAPDGEVERLWGEVDRLIECVGDAENTSDRVIDKLKAAEAKLQAMEEERALDRACLEKISEGGPDIGPVTTKTGKEYKHGFDQGCAWSGRVARSRLASKGGR